ncbi:MAG: hypothetical protein AAF941_03325 [Pseudomonadota bacterium]
MWDDRYSERGFAYGDEPNTFLAENVDKLAAGKILCIAEGQERWDTIVSTFGYLPGPLRRDVHKRVEKALKPWRWFVLEAYREEQLRTWGSCRPSASMSDMFMNGRSLREELGRIGI